jgi:hypothetical protein
MKLIHAYIFLITILLTACTEALSPNSYVSQEPIKPIKPTLGETFDLNQVLT